MDDTNFLPLFSAVIIHAMDDLKSKDTAKALDAMVFLRSGDFPIWAEAAGLPDLKFEIGLVPKAWKQIARRADYERIKNGRNNKTADISQVRRPRTARN